jgi:hypothetical protein
VTSLATAPTNYEPVINLNADAPNPLALLRPRRERPRSRRAAEERDELAPFQLIEMHQMPQAGA